MRSFQPHSQPLADAIDQVKTDNAGFKKALAPWLINREEARAECRRKFIENEKSKEYDYEEAMADDLLPDEEQYALHMAPVMAEPDARKQFKKLHKTQKGAWNHKDGTNRIKIKGMAKLRRAEGTSHSKGRKRREHTSQLRGHFPKNYAL